MNDLHEHTHSARVETPVRLLIDNVRERFQNAQSHTLSRHEDNLRAGKIAAGIGWDDRRMPLRTPRSDPRTRQIVVQEAFMAYLWAISYAMLVIEQEGYRRPMIEGRSTGEIDFTQPALAEARKLFRWALSLREEFSDWPEDLPAPDRLREINGIDYTGRANGIFTDVAVYLLFHEYAHLVHDHWNIFGPIRGKHILDVTDEEREVLKLLETEADVDAREALLASDAPDNIRLSRGFAIVLAQAAALLVVRKLSTLNQLEHPDPDTRMVNAIYSLDPEEVGPRDLFWTTACLTCDLFLRMHGLGIQPEEAETGEELLRRYLTEIDQVKSSLALP
jgi:hypothetical protein